MTVLSKDKNAQFVDTSSCFFLRLHDIEATPFPTLPRVQFSCRMSKSEEFKNLIISITRTSFIYERVNLYSLSE